MCGTLSSNSNLLKDLGFSKYDSFSTNQSGLIGRKEKTINQTSLILPIREV